MFAAALASPCLSPPLTAAHGWSTGPLLRPAPLTAPGTEAGPARPQKEWLWGGWGHGGCKNCSPLPVVGSGPGWTEAADVC